jgi:hypothetical protein
MKKIPNNPMINLINSGRIGVLSSRLTLTKVYRILAFNVVDGKVTEFNRRVDLWINKVYPNITARKKSSIKRNVETALSNDKLSWRTIMKGFDLLGFGKVHIKFLFMRREYNHDGVYTTNHTYIAIMNNEYFTIGDVIINSVGHLFNNNKVVLYDNWYNRTQLKQIPPVESGIREVKDIREVDVLIDDVASEYDRDDDSEIEDSNLI